MSQKQIRVMAVDDRPTVLKGIRSVLRRAPGITVCGDTGDATAAVALAQKTQPDVVLIGLCLRDGSAAKAIDQIRDSRPEAQFVVFSAHNAEEVLDAQIPQVLAYVLMKSETKELIRAIQAAAQGKEHSDGFITNAAAARYRNGNGSSKSFSKPGGPKLSPREIEVLWLIVEDLTNKEIATKLHISLGTADRHVTHVLAKLEVDSRLKAALWAVRNLN
jgi:two-component system, NarL family, nitrate/nitrite response regulator NarL